MIVDWIAAAITLVACELVARRRWHGWALHLVNGGLWLWLMYHAQLWGLFTLEIAFVLQAGWALYRWRNTPVEQAAEALPMYRYASWTCPCGQRCFATGLADEPVEFYCGSCWRRFPPRRSLLDRLMGR